MKKLLTILTTLVLVAVSALAVACGNTINYTAAKDQITALTEVKAGTSDIAVIDSVMANYLVSQKEWKDDLQILTGDDFKFDTEDYAIGFRKIAGDTSTKDWVDYALYLLQESGDIDLIASNYGLTGVLKEIPAKEEPAAAVAGTDFYDKVITDGKLAIGITLFAPMAIEGNHNPGAKGYGGFDCELAKLVADKLAALTGEAIEYDPKIITWSEKENELNSGNIDAIWNGFTVTEERKENICFSEAYMVNSQAIVVRKADATKYTDYASMKKAKFVAEEGSAGESTINDIIAVKVFPAE